MTNNHCDSVSPSPPPPQNSGKSQFLWDLMRKRLLRKKPIHSTSDPSPHQQQHEKSSHNATGFLSHRSITSYNLLRKKLVSKSHCGFYETYAYVFDDSCCVKKEALGESESSGKHGKASPLVNPTTCQHHLKILLREKVRVTLDDVKCNNEESVDNTGNTGIWLSEELLAFMCWKGLLWNASCGNRTTERQGDKRPTSPQNDTLGLFQTIIKEKILRHIPFKNGDLQGLKDTSSSTTLQQREINIMELGCGIGLAGFSIYHSLHKLLSALYQNASHNHNTQPLNNSTPNIPTFNIILSDGNKQVCSNVQWNYKHITGVRLKSLTNLQFKVECIPWQESDTFAPYHNKLDFIMISDCLFFKDFHEHLLNLLEACLREDGVVCILAPKRPPTMDLFLEMARSREDVHWSIKELHEYDTDVNAARERVKQSIGENLFDETIHYPHLLVMRRGNKASK